MLTVRASSNALQFFFSSNSINTQILTQINLGLNYEIAFEAI